ncbi:MAG: GntR family transcriptional regulator [Mycoplasmatales bacterium]|nr:GntR family transcriptional regulator [Mycoplasmatales bacterium]
MKSYKNIIQRYVVLKINSNEWPVGTKIPSENQLAIKFHCSRLTARSALQSLVFSGVLNSKKGSGYIVPEIKKESILKSFSISKNIKKTNIEILNPENSQWILDYFNILNKNEKVVAIKKEYWDEIGKVATQYTLLNKNAVWEINEKSIKESITKFLANQGVAIQHSSVHIKMFQNSNPILIKASKKLSWTSTLFPIEAITSFSQDLWVEKTIRVTNPRSFEAHFTKINYF